MDVPAYVPDFNSAFNHFCIHTGDEHCCHLSYTPDLIPLLDMFLLPSEVAIMLSTCCWGMSCELVLTESNCDAVLFL